MKIRNIALVAALMLMGNAMASSQVAHQADPIIQRAEGSKILLGFSAFAVAGIALSEYARSASTPNMVQRTIDRLNKQSWKKNCCALALVVATGLAIWRTKRPSMDKISLTAILATMLLN